MNVSGSTASSAPCPAASSSSFTALATHASASRITGVAWMAATRTLRMLTMLTGPDPLAGNVPDDARAARPPDQRRDLLGERRARGHDPEPHRIDGAEQQRAHVPVVVM